MSIKRYRTPVFIKFCEFEKQVEISPLHPSIHGQRTSRESFFSKIRNFWAWADKLGRNFMRHLGYFWPNYKHYFGTVTHSRFGHYFCSNLYGCAPRGPRGVKKSKLLGLGRQIGLKFWGAFWLYPAKLLALFWHCESLVHGKV